MTNVCGRNAMKQSSKMGASIHVRANAHIAAWIVAVIINSSAHLFAQTSISLTGWNYDVIYEIPSANSSSSITSFLDPAGFAFAEQGLIVDPTYKWNPNPPVGYQNLG